MNDKLPAIKKVGLLGFDLAFCFQKDSLEVAQSFRIDERRFAPEIMSGEAHGAPVDVWGLGQVAK